MNNLKFGTDGIRGKAGQFPFTANALQKLGQAISRWSKEKSDIPHILIGHDTRFSCKEIKKHLIDGLCDVAVTDGGILPTPAVLSLIQIKNFSAGIVISASHNPYTDNGIKLFTSATATKLSTQDEEQIVKYFASLDTPPMHQDTSGNSRDEHCEAIVLSETYQKNIISRFPKKFLSGKKIVLDCAHGATYKVAPQIFSELGATVITIGTKPNGKNINDGCGSLHPEKLKTLVKQNNADAGFAFDGDGDRVIAVNKYGKIKDGDDIIAILLKHPEFKNEKSVVGTVMTNHGLTILLTQKNKNLIRTKVGDKYVAEALLKNNLSLGGETSGHIIIPSYLNTGDGIFVALKTLESILLNNNWNMKSFDKLPQVIINVPIENKKDLAQEPYRSVIAKYKEKLIDGRIVVRYSGTENLLRVMVEDMTEESTKSIVRVLSSELKTLLT
jgi:phosphoglucosamine mutase